MGASATKRIKSLILRDGAFCHYCGYEIRISDARVNDSAAPSTDHIVPRALGGTNLLENLRLSHRLCNNVRGLGFGGNIKSQRFINFMARLERENYSFNPNYSGPVNHSIKENGIPVPRPLKVKSFFFSLGPLQFDIKKVQGRYWHLRIGSKTEALTEIGYRNSH